MISTYPDTITACLWLWFTSEAAAAAAAASAAGRQDHQCSRRRACCSTLAGSFRSSLWFTVEKNGENQKNHMMIHRREKQGHQCSWRTCSSTLAASSGGVSVHSGDKSCAGTTQWRKSEKSYDVEKNKEDPPPVQSEGLQNSVVPEALHQNTRVE